MLGIGVGEQEVDLLPADVLVQQFEVLPQRGLDVPVPLGDRHLGEADHVAGARLQLVPDRNFVANPLGFLGQPLSARRILPEVGVA